MCTISTRVNVALEEKNEMVPSFRRFRITFDKSQFRLNEDKDLEDIVGKDTLNSI